VQVHRPPEEPVLVWFPTEEPRQLSGHSAWGSSPPGSDPGRVASVELAPSILRPRTRRAPPATSCDHPWELSPAVRKLPNLSSVSPSAVAQPPLRRRCWVKSHIEN
jgi:hypothetical protein